jgi:hypothetical protein
LEGAVTLQGRALAPSRDLDLSAPWWLPPPGFGDVAGWLHACREVEAVTGPNDRPVPAVLHVRRGAAGPGELYVERGRLWRRGAPSVAPPAPVDPPRVETGRLRRSVDLDHAFLREPEPTRPKPRKSARWAL